MMASSALGVEELALDEKEAEALGEAVKEVADLYEFEPDPKIVAWAGLIGVATSIYAPRVTAYKFRKSEERKKRKPEEQKPPLTQHDPTEPHIEELPISQVV